MGCRLQVRGKVLGPGGQAGGGLRRPSVSSHRNGTTVPVCAAAAPRITGPGPPGSQGRGRRVGTGSWTERGGAGLRMQPPSPVLSGDRLQGPPAPPRRIFRGPGPASPRAASAARGGSAVGACVDPGPRAPPARRRHGCRSRPPQPPRPPPGARARPSADRKSCCHSRVEVRVRGLGFGIQDPGVW